MTRTEFLMLCDEFTIYPGIALECEEVCKALLESKQDQSKNNLVREALENNF
jgi:hypothetical protein